MLSIEKRHQSEKWHHFNSATRPSFMWTRARKSIFDCFMRLKIRASRWAFQKRGFFGQKREILSKKRGFLRINKYFFKASLFSKLWLPLPNDLMHPVKPQTFCFSVHPKIVVWILDACGADRRRRRKFFSNSIHFAAF